MRRSYTQTTKAKVIEWFWRYLPSEVAGTFTAILGAGITFATTDSLLAAAFIGSFCESIGYYSAAAYREVRFYYQKHHTHPTLRRITLTASHTVRGMLVEFGPAEVVDSLFFRPYLLYTLPALLGNTVAGWLVGKLLADVIFYAVAGFGYELRKMASKRWSQDTSADLED